MLNSGKKIRAWRDNKKKNILPLRKKNSERKKKNLCKLNGQSLKYVLFRFFLLHSISLLLYETRSENT